MKNLAPLSILAMLLVGLVNPPERRLISGVAGNKAQALSGARTNNWARPLAGYELLSCSAVLRGGTTPIQRHPVSRKPVMPNSPEEAV